MGSTAKRALTRGMRKEESQETGRIEAFSDGVFAIAITLLILDRKVPPRASGRPDERAHALLVQWPNYLAYLTSFLTIGVMWMNHHRLFNLIRRSDHLLMVLNTLLLLGISVVPFPTSVLAEYLGHPGGALAAMVYSGTYVVIAIFFNVLWHYAAGGMRLLGDDVDPAAVVAQTRQYAFGPVCYLVAFALAFVSVAASVAVNLALGLFFALPPRSLRLGEAAGSATGGVHQRPS